MFPRLSHLMTLLLATSAMGLKAASAADAKTGFEAWTAFGGAELSASQSGDVQMKSNPSMNFDRGLSAQAIYVVDAKVESAVRALTSLDPTRYPELEVFQQRTFRTESDARFSELKIDPKAAPFDRLLGEMVAQKNLQLANDERGRLPRQKAVSAAQEFWAKALRDRWARFAQEGVTMPVGKLVKPPIPVPLVSMMWNRFSSSMHSTRMSNGATKKSSFWLALLSGRALDC